MWDVPALARQRQNFALGPLDCMPSRAYPSSASTPDTELHE